MATTNFYLKQSGKSGFSSVVMVYQDRGKKFKYSTRLKVRKEDWKNGKLVKGKPAEIRETNSILDSYRSNINEILREGLFYKKEYPVSVVERKFKLSIGELSKGSDFIKLFEYYLESSKATKTASTIRCHSSTLRRLKDYMEFTKETLSFERMNQSFYEKFTNYLITEQNNLNNTIGKHIKTLKAFLNFCIQNELVTNNINLKPFKVIKEEVDIVCLTNDELLRIYNLEELPPYLENVRDNFCFGCFTGLRFSDIGKIKLSNLKGEFIELKTEKTRDSLRIPINVYARKILSKWEGKCGERPLPPIISNQKTNEYLKEIGRLAKINEVIEMEKFSGSKKVVVRKIKCELITSHTARRTFVTLSLEKGVRAEIVMEITGHKKYQTFKRYIKITDKVKLIEMNNFWKEESLRAV